jgi:lipopolysaccharide/colanic/teichoic acid biosynthesis glycosyltransferase
MVILGNKYQLSTSEEKELLNKVNNIHKIKINDSDDKAIINSLNNFLEINEIEFVVLNLEKDISLKLKGYLEELDYQGIKIMIFSELVSEFLNRYHIDFNEKNFEVYDSIHHDEFKRVAKRAFDVIFSFFALLFLTPVFLIIAILIKIVSPKGPVFFGHQRIGKDGKFFRIYKFRTMVPNAEEILQEWLTNHPEIKKEYEKDFKLKDDPRIIPGIGTFLRESSLDELPQFFNSFIGNMSVIGPRPIIEDEVQKYGKYVVKLYSVKPGVSGLWQVSGRNDLSYDIRVKLDMKYINNQSLWLDIKIIFKTISVMIFKKGSY